MGLFSKDIKSMGDLFLHVLQDIYYAELQIGQALPGLIEKATNRELTAELKIIETEATRQGARLEQAFELIGEKPKGAACPAIDGILKEARDIAGEVGPPKVLDAALIAAVQAIAHYKIARYGTLAAWADGIGKAAVGKLFSTTLKEAKATDRKLASLATKKVNVKAAA